MFNCSLSFDGLRLFGFNSTNVTLPSGASRGNSVQVQLLLSAPEPLKKIVERITEKKADYVIGLKQNQPALYKDTEDYFNKFSTDIPLKTTLDKGHGRIEKREYQLLTDLSWLEQKDEWKGLNGLGCARSTVTEKGETHKFTRYFITSLTDLDEFADSVRKHWSIENQLHWCLDVIFREDASRARKDNSPLNLNILRKTALNLVSQAQYKRISKKG